MRKHTLKALFGAATVMTLCVSIAQAQDTSKAKPRSQKRISVTKESPGEVVLKPDTVYRTDTLVVTPAPRIDTVMVTTIVTRIDTVIPPAPPLRLPGGWYFGLGAGTSTPSGSLYTPNSTGAIGQAQLGWQGAKSLLGGRLDASYTQPGEDSFYSGFQGHASMWMFNGDAKLNLGWVSHMFGLSPRFSLYGIGGVSYVTYKNLPIELDDNIAGGFGPANVRVGPTDWLGDWGYNVGGGAAMAWGSREIFVEARALSFHPSDMKRAWQVPVVLGINLF